MRCVGAFLSFLFPVLWTLDWMALVTVPVAGVARRWVPEVIDSGQLVFIVRPYSSAGEQ